MKKYILLLFCIILLQEQLKAQVGISATNTPPNASAMLDVSSTSKGLLPPRMTSAQRIAIATPADGLMVFDTDTKTLWNRQNGIWINLLAGGLGSGPWSAVGTGISNNTGTRVGINSANPAADLEIQGGGLVISSPYTVTTSPPTNTYTMPYSGTLATITDNAGRVLDPGGNGNFLTNTYYASYIKIQPSSLTDGFRFTFESLDLGGSSIIFSTSADVNNIAARILVINLSSNYATGRPFTIYESNLIYIHNIIYAGGTAAAGFQLLFEGLTISANTTILYSENIGSGLNFNKSKSSFASGFSKARGDYSTAMGFSTASGSYSTAMGYYSIASGNFSTAMGYSNASGNYSTAMGNSTASGYYSTAMGYGGNTNSKTVSFSISGASTASRAANDKDFQMKMHFEEYKFLTGASNDVTITNGQITTSNTLSVFGVLNNTISNYGYLGAISNAPAGYYTGSTTVPYSIYSVSRVLGLEFNAFSDARHKKLRSYSNGSKDLALLNQLNVSNYTFIDTVGKGTKMQMGFIAQEVEKIVPEAVNKIQDYIPSVYDMAKSMVYDTKLHTLTITTNKPHDFQAKDEIKMISLDKEHKVKVDKIIDANTFTVSNWEKPVENIFVFGKQVNDFRTVDYDRLFTLGISSIQELSRRVELLEKENGILKTESKTFKQMKSEIAELRAMIIK